MLQSLSLIADLIMAYFTSAVFWIDFRYSVPCFFSIAERTRAILPVSIGTEKLVPLFSLHSPGYKLKPRISSPGSRISGLGTPIPTSMEFFVIPRDEKVATRSKL